MGYIKDWKQAKARSQYDPQRVEYRIVRPAKGRITLQLQNANPA